MSASVRAKTRIRFDAEVNDSASSIRRGEPVGVESVKPPGTSRPRRTSPTCSANGAAHTGAARNSARKASVLIAPPLLASSPRRDPHPQCVQADEAGGVGLIVGAFVVLDSGDRGVEMRTLRGPA